MKKTLLATLLFLGLIAAPLTAGAGNGNYTMLDGNGGIVGGANDVEFTWDGTLNTAAENAMTNAAISSNCPFFGQTWEALDVKIFGPGTFTFEACPEDGSAACNPPAPITMTVDEGQMGAHMLFNWGTAQNIDAVNVWDMYGTFPILYTGEVDIYPDLCRLGDPLTVWDLVSTDDDGDGVPGVPFVDGAFHGFNPNFNLMISWTDPEKIPPVISLLGDQIVILEQGMAFADPGATAEDNQDGDLSNSIIVGGDPVDTDTLGTYIITYDVMDSDGNQARQITRTVNVEGREPTITLLGGKEIILVMGGAFTDPGATASDIKDGDLTSAIMVGGDTVDTTTAGTYYITYDVVDSDGNQAEQANRTVTVNPIPIGTTYNNNFTMLDAVGGIVGGSNDVVFFWDGTMNLSFTGAIPNATLSSETPFFGQLWQAHHVTVYGPGTYTFETCLDDGSVACTPPAPITMTVGQNQIGVHSLFDWASNVNMDVVNVWDINKAFTPSTMYTGDGGDPATIWHGMSSDANGDGVNGIPLVDGPFVGFNVNFNVMGIALSDEFMPPVITMLGGPSLSLELGETFTDPGATALDTQDGDLTDSIIVGGDTVDTDTIGTYIITYNVTDSDGNAAVPATRTITVAGVEPEISLIGGERILLHIDQLFSDPGATATDVKDGDLTASIIVGGDTVDSSTLGTYVITYDVMDSDGNAAPQKQRTVIVGHGSSGNNYTFIDQNNFSFGGANDVTFIWDGTLNTSVSNAVVNAALSTETPFFGLVWNAHHVTLYGPGHYTFYTDCPPGEADCGNGTPMLLKVKKDQIGLHLLADWGTTKDTDIVNLWNIQEVFGPSTLYTLDGGDPNQVWDGMSSDYDKDGINGIPIVDGPFLGFMMNFNVMGVTHPADAILLDSPEKGKGKGNGKGNSNNPSSSQLASNAPSQNVSPEAANDSSSGCSAQSTPSHPFDHAEWFLVALFFGLHLIHSQKRKDISS